MPITNARVLSPNRVTIAGPATDARIIETQAPVAQPPVTMPNPNAPEQTGSSVVVAAPTGDAVVVEDEPLETTAPEQAEPVIARRRR